MVGPMLKVGQWRCQMSLRYHHHHRPRSAVTPLFAVANPALTCRMRRSGEEPRLAGPYRTLVPLLRRRRRLATAGSRLTGQIPEEISLLIELTSLNLSSNQLIGKIPNQIGDLKQLESLDLSYNEFTGEIPSGLSALTSLSYLNLSYNNLSGAIPSGAQLQALDNQIDIYIGNAGLCGYPLSQNCSASATDAERSVNHEDADHVASLYLGMGIGFVVGLWVVFCTMLLRTTCVIAYFQIIDKLYEKIYVWVAIIWARLMKKTHDDSA